MFYAYQIEYLFIAFHTDFTSLTIYPSHKKEPCTYFQLVYCNATRIQILLILAFITANDCICCMHIAGTVVMNRIRTLDWSFGNILRTNHYHGSSQSHVPRKLKPLFRCFSFFWQLWSWRQLSSRPSYIFASKKGVSLQLYTEELQAFIGLNIAMGMLHLLQVRDYWSTGEILATPWFPSIMSRDRFFKILCYLHLVDSAKQK